MKQTFFKLQQVAQVVGVEKTEQTSRLAQALAAQNEPDGTLVLACEQTHTFKVGEKWISSGEGGIYFSLILRSLAHEKTALKTMAQALADILQNGLQVKVRTTKNQVYIWDKNSCQWKIVAELAADVLPLGGVIISVGLLLNNVAPREISKQYISIKKLAGNTIQKELFLEDLLDTFWKYLSWATPVLKA